MRMLYPLALVGMERYGWCRVLYLRLVAKCTSSETVDEVILYTAKCNVL